MSVTLAAIARAAIAQGLDAEAVQDCLFPNCPPYSYTERLRDEFAAKAMVGLCHFWVQVHAKATINDPDPEIIARMAYEYADAMLKARLS